MNISAVIVASGVGLRMNTDIPKQYLPLAGKRVLEHSLAPFLKHPRIAKVVVVINSSDQFFADLVIDRHKIVVAIGGESRAISVVRGLDKLSADDWVLVHDGARPCITSAEIDRLLDYTDDNGAILALPSVDTLKKIQQGQKLQTLDREQIFRAMTPQFFKVGILRSAIKQAQNDGIALTDDASAMEYAGFSPQLVRGEISNIKITYPDDLALAELYLQRNKQ